jgi:4-amino-4-deoxy-L-arabinose transferase-like glycosyltransferase
MFYCFTVSPCHSRTEMLKKTNILISIILLAFFLRVYALSEVPAGLDYDETEFAFNAYTISKYLVNENNQFLPYEVNTYGNYRPMGLVYFIAGSLKIFGNNILAVRLPNALFGVLTIPLVYFLVKMLFKKEKIAFFMAFLLSINPWHIFLSRGTAEPVMALFFIVLMLIFLVKFFQNKQIFNLILIYIFGFISFFSYTGVLPIIFLFALPLSGYFFCIQKKINWKVAIPFIALIIFPLIPVMITNPGYLNGRLKQTSVFYGMGKEGIELVNDEKIREIVRNRETYQNFITRFFHNIPVATVNTVLNNWGAHLSPSFLYFQGGYPLRLQVPDSGIFLPLEFIFLIGGCLFLFRDKKYLLFALAVSFIAFGFLPAALTVEEVPSTHRTIFAVLGFLIFESYFLYILSKNFTSKLIAVPLIILFTYEMSVVNHNYLVMQPRHKNSYRHFEMFEIAKYLKLNQNKYDNIYITKNGTEPGYYYYFFNNLDPKPFIENTSKNHLGTWSDGKFHYIHAPCADVPYVGKSLIIEGAAFCTHDGGFIKYIYNSDGQKFYRMVERL